MPVRTPALALVFAATSALMLGFAAPADATLWQPVQTSLTSQTEIDIDSIAKKEGTATAWMQQVNAEPIGSKSGAYFVYRTMKTQVRYQCAQRTASVLTRGYFNDSGVEVSADRSPEEARGIAPDSPEDRALGIACAADPKKAAAALRRPEPVASGNRYMDGPAAPLERRAGLVQTSAAADEHAHDAPAPAAPKAKAEVPPKAAADKPAPTASAGAPATATVAPAAAAPKRVAEISWSKPAAQKDVEPAAHAAPRAHAEPRKTAESRENVVNRVLRERGLSPAVAAPLALHGHEEAHWSYEGENAPYRWGDMKTDYATCKSGQRQSPIDIRNPVMAEMDPITFHYEESPLKVLNNGHTIQVEIAPGSFILYAGARYELIQMHFHTPSEERINGRGFDMVAHLVHKSAQGKLAVVAVLLTAGQANPVIETIWNTMPGTAGLTRERPELRFNPFTLLPADRGYYSFQGSLTTPPCSEGVQWLVMRTPVELGREQVTHFGALYPMNARPLQPANDRVIKAGR